MHFINFKKQHIYSMSDDISENNPGIKRSKFTEFAKYLSLPLVGILATIGFQQFFYKDNKEVDTNSELVKIQYEHLNRARHFASLGEPLATLRFEIIYVTQGKKEFGRDTQDASLPIIAVDSAKFAEWQSTYFDLEKHKYALDHRVYEAASEIFHFVAMNPFPRTEHFETVQANIWSDKTTIGRWQTLNGILKIKIEQTRTLGYSD
jgi:hypothetical protein